MFSWSHENVIEVDLPLQIAWDFYMNPVNIPKWEDRFGACVLEEELKGGSRVRAKIKNKAEEILICLLKSSHTMNVSIL